MQMDINALFKVSYGLYIISSLNNNNQYNGFLGNAISQVNSDPPTFEVIVNKNNLTHDYIAESNLYSVSILEQAAPFPYLGKFGFKSGRDINKFEGINYRVGLKGVPIVTDYTIAYFTSEVFKTVDMGSHTIFIGSLLDCDIIKAGEPMTYAYYHDVLRGKTAKNAPTFIQQQNR
jgi:flavin reductase (DIM6/NTAB) family NADH-FMN oxidoreductase RutF